MNDALTCGHVGCGPCSEHERAVRRDERRLLARQLKAGLDEKRLLAFYQALEDPAVRRAGGLIVHLLTQVLIEEESA